MKATKLSKMTAFQKLNVLMSKEGRGGGWDITISCTGETSFSPPKYSLFARGLKGVIDWRSMNVKSLEKLIEKLWAEVQTMEANNGN